jgi:peptidoglycan L-alanyl-D-glutamate endopeptidase CwlK
MTDIGHADRLAGLHPSLAKVVLAAATISEVRFMVVEGCRSDEECYINFGKGRTPAECVNAGCPSKYSRPSLPKVTWLGHPLSSNHRKKPDGFGHAVDLLPAPYDWKDAEPFEKLSKAMFAAAAKLGVRLRWGWDWDGDGKQRERGETDGPHFELVL